MKKKLAVLFCVLILVFAFTMAVAAEGEGDTEHIWDFWSLLSGSNVNYLGVIGMLLTTLGTVFRMFLGADGLKNLGSWLLDALKNLIPSSK